jgi:outer membrane protein assembly factor BamB
MLWSLSASPLSAGDNWPQFRGPGGRGHSDSTGLPVRWSETENVKWKTAIHGRGWSSPVIWNDQIWVTTATEDGKEMFAVCLDKNSGKVLHDIKVFDNEEPQFCHPMNSYASPTPVVEKGRVYVHFGSYGTACLDAKTAATIWSRRDFPCDHFRGPGSSPILFGNLLIVHFDGFDYQYVVALDKSTGKLVWKTDRDIDYGTTDGDIFKAFCTPLVIDVGGQQQLVSPTSKATIAYEPQTGREIWRVRYDGFSATAQPLVGDGVIFLNTGFSKADLLAVRLGGRGDITDSHVLWTAKKTLGSKPSQVLVVDLIFNAQDNGVASCLDAQTGQEVWAKRLGGQFSASLVYADGRVYLCDHDGKTYVISPERQYRELAVNTLDAGCMATPAISGRAIYLRTQTHLYRIEK